MPCSRSSNTSRKHEQPFQQRLGLDAAVRFDDADRDVDAFLHCRVRGLEHLIRLAHSGAHAEEDLQLSLPRVVLLLLQRGEQGVRIGTGIVCCAHGRGFSLASWCGPSLHPHGRIVQLAPLVRQAGKLGIVTGNVNVPRCSIPG